MPCSAQGLDAGRHIGDHLGAQRIVLGADVDAKLRVAGNHIGGPGPHTHLAHRADQHVRLDALREDTAMDYSMGCSLWVVVQPRA